jgi:hypothetical protein
MAVNAQEYFATNPDVAAAFAANNYGMSADEFANYHFANYGASESRTPVAGVTNEQIIGFLKDNPDLTDEQIVSSMKTYGISPSQMAGAVGLNEGEIASRVAATVPYGQAVLLGDTWVQPNYQVTGSGENQQIGGVESVSVYKTTGGINDEVATGTQIQNYSPTGEFAGTGVTKKTDSLLGEFLLGSLGLFGGAALAGFGGAAGAAGTVGTTGLTMAELAQLDLALGGAGGTAGATALANSLTTGALAGTLTNLTGGSGTGALTGGLATGGAVAGMGGAGGLTAGAGGVTGLTTGAGGVTGLTTAGGLAGANTLLGGSTLGSTLGGLTTGAVGSTLGSTLGSTVGSTLGSTVGSNLANTAASTLGRGLTSGSLANLFSGGLGTAGSLLQMQESREAAQRAQARIDAETAAAKAAAQFRPVGMTTRFGTSEFQVDPVTGQLTSAGYTLSPEAKNAQDRLVKLAESGLQQAEGAQKAFEPLQTGAQSLFKLGQGYLAEKPEDVAKNYLASQMALLQPGRELELANLQNRLQQQGRGGLAVAQGGTMGATTPELQALFNARAQQEAQLAANAQQYGQQQVQFGAGLLGTGAQTMGQYYGGQQAAYAPYTTALGQVQGLEALGQQPLTTGINLGQISSQAGANVGKLGLTGAQLSTNLATGADATRNLAAQGLIAAGSPNAQFGQAIGGLFGGGLQSAFSGTGLGSSGFGTGLAYGNQDLGLFL